MRIQLNIIVLLLVICAVLFLNERRYPHYNGYSIDTTDSIKLLNVGEPQPKKEEHADKSDHGKAFVVNPDLYPVAYGKIEFESSPKAPNQTHAQSAYSPKAIVKNSNNEPEFQPKVDDIRVLLIPSKETTVSSTTTGRLTFLKGKLGERFRAGELLATFDCKEQQVQVEIAEADLSSAMDTHEAKVKLQGLQQASELEVALAASEANKARAQLKLNKAIAAKCKVYAPWSGRISKAHAKVFMTVNAGEPLLDIVNSANLKVKLNVPSNLLSQIKTGKSFKITIDETLSVYQAQVSRINSRVDPVSQTVEIEAKLLDKYPELLAGMSGTANLLLDLEVI